MQNHHGCTPHVEMLISYLIFVNIFRKLWQDILPASQEPVHWLLAGGEENPLFLEGLAGWWGGGWIPCPGFRGEASSRCGGTGNHRTHRGQNTLVLDLIRAIALCAAGRGRLPVVRSR